MGSTFRKGSAESGQSRAISQEQADLARFQRQLGQQQADIGLPLQRGVADVFGQFLKTGQAPAFLDLPAAVEPLAALSLPGLGNEQNRLRNELLAQGARGGLLQQQLGNVALQGSLQRTGLLQQDLLRQEQRDLARAALRQSLFGGAGELGTGSQSLALQGLAQGSQSLGAAASNLSQLGLQRIQQNMAAQQGIGQMLGMAGGAALMYGAPAPAAGSLGAAKLASR